MNFCSCFKGTCVHILILLIMNILQHVACLFVLSILCHLFHFIISVALRSLNFLFYFFIFLQLFSQFLFYFPNCNHKIINSGARLNSYYILFRIMYFFFHIHIINLTKKSKIVGNAVHVCVFVYMTTTTMRD